MEQSAQSDYLLFLLAHLKPLGKAVTYQGYVDTVYICHLIIIPDTVKHIEYARIIPSMVDNVLYLTKELFPIDLPVFRNNVINGIFEGINCFIVLL